MSKNRGKKGGQDKIKAKVKKTEDKTFGMKNKKGKKAQQIVNTPKKFVQKKKLNEEEVALEKVLNSYSKPKVEVKVGGEESQQIIEMRKTEKADPFKDIRELRNADREKRGEKLWAPKNKNTCMFFVQAVEEKKYGWFWECPNDGDNCPYYHKLPEDYKFKEEEEEKETRTLEEIIEERRSSLTGGTPVNEKTFKEWKDKKLKIKAELEEERINQRTKDLRTGRAKMTGREIMIQQYQDKKFDDEEGDDFDIISLLKKKVEEEEQLDQENAKKINEVAQEFSGFVEPNEEEIERYLKGEGGPDNEEVDDVEVKIEDSQTIVVKEVKIDVDLFNEDIDDLPDDEENGEN